MRLERIEIGDVLGGVVRLVAPQTAHDLRHRGVGNERPYIWYFLRLRQWPDAVQLTGNGAMLGHATDQGFVQRQSHVAVRTPLDRGSESAGAYGERAREVEVRVGH